MGNFTRRAIAFVLGMVVGIVTLFGGMAGAMYWAFKNLSLSKIGVMQEDESGLKDATIEDLVALIVMAQADPESFTVQKLEEQGIDLIKLLQGAGVDLSKADEIDFNTIKDISPILLFSKNGLNEISFSTVFALLPKGEDGVYPVFSAGARNMLRGYSLGYLLANDETTGQMRLFSEISGLKIGSLFPKTFTESYSEEKSEYVYTAENSALEKLGNLKLSLITNNVSGDSEFDIGYELNEGELKDIGSTYLVDFLADLISGGDEEARSETVKTLSLFDGVLVKELFKFNDDGDVYEFNAEVLLAGFSIGKFMGYTKCTESETCPIHENVLECNGAWYEKCTESDTCPVHGNSGCAGKENEYKEYAGDTAEGLITKNLIDISIEDLFAGGLEVTSFVKDIYLGHALGYKIASSEDGITIPSGYCDKSCSLSDGHEHEYYWVNDADEFVGTLYNDFANISLESALSGGINLEGIIEGSCLGELLGKYRKDGVWYDDSACTEKTKNESAMDKILLSIYDKNIDDFSNGTLKLEELLDGIKLGELMGYKFEDGAWKNEDGEVVELSSLNKELYDLDVSKLIKGETKIDETFNDLPLGELLGKYKDGDVWYDDANFETKTKNDSAMDKIMLVIYNKTIDDFKTGTLELNELLDGIKLGELMGYTIGEKDGYCKADCAIEEEGHKHEYYWLKDGGAVTLSVLNKELYAVEVGKLIKGEMQLEDVLDDLTLGDLLGKYKSGEDWYEDAEHEELVKNETAMDKIMLAIYDKSMSDISNGSLELKDVVSDIKLGELMGYTYDGTVWKDKNGVVQNFTKFDKTLYETEVSSLVDGTLNFKTILGDLYVGELMGNTYDGGVWKDKDGLPLTLDVLNKAIYEIEVSELLNGGVEFKTKLGHIYVGELMGYTGSVGAWYDGTTPVSKLNSVMADVKLEEIFDGSFNLKSKVNTLTLGDVITIDAGTPKILQMLEGSKINELSQDINKMYLGEVMGYKKCSNDASCLVHSGGVGCTGKWHRENGSVVDGLNAKIAGYTFETFASTGFNTNDFTLGDVITQDSEYGTGSIFGLLDVGHIDGYEDLEGSTDIEKRKNIPISQVSVRTKAGVTNATLQDLMNCGVFSLDQDEKDKLTNVFTLADKGDWTSYTMQGFITTVIDMLPG